MMKDRIRGCIVGGAIGDAFGYPVEFMTLETITAKYGEDGITDYDMSNHWLGERSQKALFSDDTQMTLYTIEGLNQAVKEGLGLVPTICDAYVAWYGGQAGKRVKISYKSELSGIKELNQRRAPGTTCMSSLEDIYRGKEPKNNSKGCGGVMRVAPIGCYGALQGWELAETAKIAGEVAELTHQHLLSTYSSAALAVIVQQCLVADSMSRKKFEAIVERSLQIVEDLYKVEAKDDAVTENPPEFESFKTLISLALEMQEFVDIPDSHIIENKLGEGWVAEEALAIAVYSVLRHIDDFTACMVCAVNHSGDSDSTGAIAGNIHGAIMGYDKLPKNLADGIQLKDLLIRMADSLGA